jgi:uncharacterized alkaline shock family protein YloU
LYRRFITPEIAVHEANNGISSVLGILVKILSHLHALTAAVRQPVWTTLPTYTGVKWHEVNVNVEDLLRSRCHAFTKFRDNFEARIF